MTVEGEKRVLVTGGDIEQAWLSPLEDFGLEVDIERETLAVGPLFERLQGCSYYLYGGIEAADELDDGQLRELHDAGLELIAFAGKGVTDFLNVQGAQKAGIVVANTPGAVEPSVAEFTVMLALAVLRDVLPRSLAWLQQNGTVTTARDMAAREIGLGRDLAEVTVGVVGLGDIGRLVAELLVTGYGTRVVYTSRTRKEALEEELGLTYLEPRNLVDESDLVTIHLANTAGSRDFTASIPFEQTSSPFFLVNTASQALIGAERLAGLMSKGTITSAAFDKIYSHEELESSGLVEFLPDRLLVTNHAANATRGAWRRMTGMAVDNIVACASGRCAPNAVELP